MWKILVFVIAAIVTRDAASVTASFNPTSLTKFNVFVKTPISKEPIHTGGRVIERHIEYLANAGYKSILSVVEFGTNDTIHNGVPGSYPSTAYEVQLAEANGMVEKFIASSFTVEYAKEISAMIDSLPKPLYVHCHVGYMASVFVQLHLYLKGEILATDIYPNGISLGYDYQNNTDVVNLINAITGRSDSPTPERIEQTLAQTEYSYKYYSWTHRLGHSDVWFNAGQILDTHLDAIKTAGYTGIISFRVDGEATARLPTDPVVGPIPNHEFSNYQGAYSKQLEENLVTERGLKFAYLPLDPSNADTWTVATFDRYRPLLEAVTGPTVVHCASGYRSSVFVLTFQAFQRGLCRDWVIAEAERVGFNLHSSSPTASDLAVLDFAYEVLRC